MLQKNFAYDTWKTTPWWEGRLSQPKYVRQCFQCKELYDERFNGEDLQYNICSHKCMEEWFSQDDHQYEDIMNEDYDPDYHPDCA